MIKFSRKFLSKCIIFTFIVVLSSGFKVFAATDTAATFDDLQSKLSAAMHSRQASYSVIYSGGTISTASSDFKNVVSNIFATDDYIKFTTKSYGGNYSYSNNTLTFNFTFTYWNTAAMDSYVDNKVNEILSQIITSGMNDYQKEKAIHDWIEANVAYDTTLAKHSDYDALVAPYKTVCQGYALLAYDMLTKAGIQTKILEGTADGGSHAWNEVNVNGTWYQLDTTWDDPAPDVPGRVLYDYYNLTDAQIKINHKWTNTYPAANTSFIDDLNNEITSDSSNASFYEDLYNDVGGEYLSSDNTASNTAQLGAKVQQAINNNQSSIKIRYTNSSTLAADIKTVVSGISNIKSYSYSASKFIRGTSINDVIVSLDFTCSAPVSVVEASINQNTLDLSVGKTNGTLIATVLPANASNKNIIWTTSNAEVASVSNGIVKPVGAGTTTITATTIDGSHTASCLVTVKQGVSSVALDKKTAYVKLKDTDLTLKATVNPTNATNKDLTWSSNNIKVATVDNEGKVHPIAAGTAVITAASAQDPTKKATCTITVPVDVTGITIGQSLTLQMGNTASLKPIFNPTNATIKTVSWSSSDASIVKVSSTGVLTPMSEGKATITAKSDDGDVTATCSVTVIYGVSSVTLDQKTAYIKLKDTDLTLKATVNPTNATNKNLIWSSSNTKVATVDSNGKVHPVAAGTAVITAASVQDPTKKATCTITVPVDVTGIAISSSLTLQMGSTTNLKPIFTPINSTIKTVSWSSSKDSVVKVSSTGVLTPVSEGTAIITVKSDDGNSTANCTVTVVYGVSSVTLDQKTAYVKLKDTDLTLKATVNPINATNKGLIWSSSNTKVATVDSNGKVHPVAVGTAIITAASVQDPTKKATCIITVPVDVTGIAISSNLILKMGSTTSLKPTFNPTNATMKTVSWSSSKDSVVKVSSTGVLTPVSEGTATITVKSDDGKFTADCTVTVIYGVSSITLDKTSASMTVQSSDLTLSATINPINATNKNLTWSSSNAKIATVDGNGKVHPIAAGTVVITVSSVQDQTKKAICKITIK